MRTRVSDLYHSGIDQYSLILHSGENGLSNSVSWIYLAEDIQNMSFLKGGELVITTGLFTQSGTSLFDFIRSLVTFNCSGLYINVGRYLETADITPEIMEFCNVNKFPLITMPWKVHLVDIMQEYCKILLQNTQSMDHLNAAFQGGTLSDHSSRDHSYDIKSEWFSNYWGLPDHCDFKFAQCHPDYILFKQDTVKISSF
ncbi:PucR family transcriptional regulator ligand-binding domain-containing protein [Lacrimispora xylanisolvens]|uniref:PucR family transcriptional regulator ligand-binding domain-containing protein n=1 Tax=Lacrimispora xylanisolvens TaxID=384636 RepID=UPI002402641A